MHTNLHPFASEYSETKYESNTLYEKCDVCNMHRKDKAHPAEYLIDQKNEVGLTWWQSDTMEYDGIQYPNSVNITIHLGSKIIFYFI